MKKIFTLLFITCISLASFAFNAAFQIELPSHAQYRITFNGQPYQFTGKTFSFDQFPAGTQQLFVEQLSGSSQPRTIYAGLIFFESNTRITAKVDSWGRLEVTRREPMAQQGGNFPPFWGNMPPYGLPGGNGSWGGWNGFAPFVSESNYQALLQTLNSAWFDNQKQDIALHAIRNNNYTAAQIAGILKTFTFDSYRLTVAKEAYKHSKDKGNFFLVTSAFDHTGNARALSDYMKNFVN
jgi:hypothetical protein